jgi:ABC-type bacteriocin/lantibiotic exporter with double-glycine peptidase domain
LMAVAGGIILYTQNSFLFGIAFLMVIAYAVIVFVFNKPIKNINRKQMENNAQLTSYLVESLNGIETIKSFNAERKSNIETEKKFVKLLKSVFKGGWIYWPVSGLLDTQLSWYNNTRKGV